MENIASKDFDSITKNGQVVVDFYGIGCGNCRMIEPFLIALEKENPDIKFIKIDIDTAPELIDRFDVTALPTLLFMQDGKVLQSLVGLKPKNFLARVITETFN